MKTVTLYGTKAAGRVALVDDSDWELVSNYRWNVQEAIRVGARGNRHVAGPYAVTSMYPAGKIRTVLMHKLITGWPQTDHKNHDGLDNRRENLRAATHGQNMHNRRADIGACSSRYKGVTWHRQSGKWMARIQVDGQRLQLGMFDTELEAAVAYDAAARQAHGSFACANFSLTN
jgi:hypothetical protein